MTGVGIERLLGPPIDTNPDAAIRFIKGWHGSVARGKRGARVAVVSMHTEKTNHNMTLASPIGDICKAIESDGLDPLVTRHGASWNLYTNILLVKDQPPARKRGGKENTLWSPGLCADLDVKPGAFGSQEECMEFLRELWPLWPTMIVASGSGGLQPYWRVTGGLGPGDHEKYMEMLWSWLSRRAGCDIDETWSCDRIMRLPGSIRWPKGTVQEPRAVELLYDAGPEYCIDQIEEVCSGPYQARIKEQHDTREFVQMSDRDAEQVLVDIASGEGWTKLVSLASFEEAYNAQTTWDSILIPHGWTLEPRNERQGAWDRRRYWRRPGSDGGHQATTDYEPSPNVMTVFSSAAETGLKRLRDAKVTLTKLRVDAELNHGGDVTALIEKVLAG